MINATTAKCGMVQRLLLMGDVNTQRREHQVHQCNGQATIDIRRFTAQPDSLHSSLCVAAFLKHFPTARSTHVTHCVVTPWEGNSGEFSFCQL